jgi:hypothetical protein
LLRKIGRISGKILGKNPAGSLDYLGHLLLLALGPEDFE